MRVSSLRFPEEIYPRREKKCMKAVAWRKYSLIVKNDQSGPDGRRYHVTGVAGQLVVRGGLQHGPEGESGDRPAACVREAGGGDVRNQSGRARPVERPATRARRGAEPAAREIPRSHHPLRP